MILCDFVNLIPYPIPEQQASRLRGPGGAFNLTSHVETSSVPRDDRKALRALAGGTPAAPCWVKGTPAAPWLFEFSAFLCFSLLFLRFLCVKKLRVSVSPCLCVVIHLIRRIISVRPSAFYKSSPSSFSICICVLFYKGSREMKQVIPRVAVVVKQRNLFISLSDMELT